MTIHEKAVIRFEAVCDSCGEFLGEYGERRRAAEAITVHRLRDHGPRRPA
jgi:hypothetical protein